jgi:hypothetical protein
MFGGQDKHYFLRLSDFSKPTVEKIEKQLDRNDPVVSFA